MTALMRRRGSPDVPYWPSALLFIPRTIHSQVRIPRCQYNRSWVYVLIGYYTLELAKACWNAYVLSSESIWLKRTNTSLRFARKILEVVGGEEEDEIAAGVMIIERLEPVVAKEPALP
jgi:hypothetical protein